MKLLLCIFTFLLSSSLVFAQMHTWKISKINFSTKNYFSFSDKPVPMLDIKGKIDSGEEFRLYVDDKPMYFTLAVIALRQDNLLNEKNYEKALGLVNSLVDFANGERDKLIISGCFAYRLGLDEILEPMPDDLSYREFRTILRYYIPKFEQLAKNEANKERFYLVKTVNNKTGIFEFNMLNDDFSHFVQVSIESINEKVVMHTSLHGALYHPYLLVPTLFRTAAKSESDDDVKFYHWIKSSTIQESISENQMNLFTYSYVPFKYELLSKTPTFIRITQDDDEVDLISALAKTIDRLN